MIGFILGSTGALLIGLVIGHPWGQRSARKKLFAPDFNPPGISLQEFSIEPLSLRIAREADIPAFASPDLKCAILRDAERQIQKDALNQLERRGFLSPREVYHAFSPLGIERIRFELSLLVAKHPAHDEHPAPYEKPQIYKVNHPPHSECKRGV